MKILHVNYIPSQKYMKEKKIQFQANAANEANLPIDFLVLNSSTSAINENIEYIKLPLPENGYLKTIFQKIFRYYYIGQALKKKSNYDIIIIRYPLAVGLGSQWFYRKYGDALFTEHHTLEPAEISSYFRFKPFSEIVSTYETWKRKRVMPNCRGVIGVTSEIADFAHTFNPHGEKHIFSNGIRVSDIEIIPKPISQKKDSIRLLFIASNFSVWHGLDRLLDGLSLYQGSIHVIVDLAGNLFDDLMLKKISSLNKKSDQISIVTHGFTNGSDLDNLYEQADIGISSLAIHRNGMREACVLKTREYCARGLPFIYSYEDPDLPSSEIYALKIPADETPLNINSLITFFNSLRTIKDLRFKMRADAITRMDWTIKFSKLYNNILVGYNNDRKMND